jgi:hypothetical protein
MKAYEFVILLLQIKPQGGSILAHNKERTIENL